MHNDQILSYKKTSRGQLTIDGKLYIIFIRSIIPLRHKARMPGRHSASHKDIIQFYILRGVAQLVARLLWEQDAGGSSPSTPTILSIHKRFSCECSFFMQSKKQPQVIQTCSCCSVIFSASANLSDNDFWLCRWSLLHRRRYSRRW